MLPVGMVAGGGGWELRNAQRKDRSGVNRLRCSDCNATYIGQTRRSLLVNIMEHECAMKSMQEFSRNIAP